MFDSDMDFVASEYKREISDLRRQLAEKDQQIINAKHLMSLDQQRIMTCCSQLADLRAENSTLRQAVKDAVVGLRKCINNIGLLLDYAQNNILLDEGTMEAMQGYIECNELATIIEHLNKLVEE